MTEAEALGEADPGIVDQTPNHLRRKYEQNVGPVQYIPERGPGRAVGAPREGRMEDGHAQDGGGPALYASARALRDELAAYLAERPHRDGPSAALWPGRIPGSGGDSRGLDYRRQFDVGSVIRYYFKPALKELGLVGVRWHDLRHYYATVMISMIGKGAQYTLYEVSRWMGHASYQTTVDVYGHLLEAKPNVDILDDIMAATEGEAGTLRPLRRLI